MPDRSGKRRAREQTIKRRVPRLGYYFIVTDTQKTEENYLLGFRNAIPQALQGNLVIKVWKADTASLVDKAMEMASLQPQYGEPWIVFDRDRVTDFDQIIMAAQEKGIRVGWSNPCIEIWFAAYFGAMPTCLDSVSCCNGFARMYQRHTGQMYEKNDRALYDKLFRYGNEENAIQVAAGKLAANIRDCTRAPSAMCPCTTLFQLIQEIRAKVDVPR